MKLSEILKNLPHFNLCLDVVRQEFRKRLFPVLEKLIEEAYRKGFDDGFYEYDKREFHAEWLKTPEQFWEENKSKFL